MRATLLAPVLLSIAATACGSTSPDAADTTDASTSDTSTSDTSPSTDTSSSDATGDVTHLDTGDGGCVYPVEGADCTSTASACAQEGDPCCIGYVWNCQSGKWVKLGLGCACLPKDTGVADTGGEVSDAKPVDAGPFACGSVTCTPDQICTARPPGVPTDASPPPIYYSCMTMPSACVATPTCDCVKAHVDASCSPTTCSVDASGHVTLGCMGA
jgi:hypothetical protein